MELIFLYSRIDKYRSSNDSSSMLVKTAGITNRDCIKLIYVKMTIMFNFGSSSKSIATVWK